MKYSKLTYEILKIIGEGVFDVVEDLMESGYLAGKSPEFREKYYYFKEIEKKQFKKKITRLQQQNLIEKIEDNYYITLRGRKHFNRLNKKFSILIKQDKKWNGKLYLIMFDIPEEARNDRNTLRIILQEAGLRPIQKSIYVYPYNFFEQFKKIKKLFPRRHLQYIEIYNSEINQDIFNFSVAIFKKDKII